MFALSFSLSPLPFWAQAFSGLSLFPVSLPPRPVFASLSLGGVGRREGGTRPVSPDWRRSTGAVSRWHRQKSARDVVVLLPSAFLLSPPPSRGFFQHPSST